MDNDLPQPLLSALILFDGLLEGSDTPDNLQSADVLQNIKQALEDRKTILTARPTAKLWLQYLEMVCILQQFIKEERTGN